MNHHSIFETRKKPDVQEGKRTVRKRGKKGDANGETVAESGRRFRPRQEDSQDLSKNFGYLRGKRRGGGKIGRRREKGRRKKGCSFLGSGSW